VSTEQGKDSIKWVGKKDIVTRKDEVVNLFLLFYEWKLGVVEIGSEGGKEDDGNEVVS
jgi:hypothetical protein